MVKKETYRIHDTERSSFIIYYYYSITMAQNITFPDRTICGIVES